MAIDQKSLKAFFHAPFQLLMFYLNPQQPWFRLMSLMQYLSTPKLPQIELKDYNIES